MTKDCPCTTVVKLSTEVKYQFEAVNAELERNKETVKAAREEMRAFFREFKLQLSECMESIQESTMKLNDGAGKFKEIEETVDRVEADLLAHDKGVEGTHKKEECRVKERLAGHDKEHTRIWRGLAIVAVVLLTTGHASDVLAMAVKIINKLIGV